MNEIRIIDRKSDGELPPGYVVTTFTWPARKGPKPLLPASEKYVKRQAAETAESFARRCRWAGL